eukprot:3282312-Prymnesium_polylepis.2
MWHRIRRCELREGWGSAALKALATACAVRSGAPRVPMLSLRTDSPLLVSLRTEANAAGGDRFREESRGAVPGQLRCSTA